MTPYLEVYRAQAGALLDIFGASVVNSQLPRHAWTAVMAGLTQHLSLTDFHRAMLALVQGRHHPIDAPPDTIRAVRAPVNSRAYLESHVGPLLQQGLAELLSHLADNHIRVASKALWADDGHLPEGYLPSNPLRQLGQWLHAHNPQRMTAADDPRALDWGARVPWEALTLRRRVWAVFLHLDPGCTGCA